MLLGNRHIPSPFNVCMVTVTYGDRADLLEQVVEATIALGVGRVVIVDNASIATSAVQIDRICQRHRECVKLVRLDRNLGSAGGFKAGLEMAERLSGAEFIWLLDDDNKPTSSALEHLVLAYQLLGSDVGNALVSLRPARAEYCNAARWSLAVGIVPNSFLGFHIRTWLVDRLRPRMHTEPERFNSPLLALGYAPYGGFLFHRSWLSRVGFPNAEFFLYEDDHEYSMRFLRAGGNLYLCAASTLLELEPSWGAESAAGPALVSSRSQELRVYYGVRNRVFLEAQAVSSRIIYYSNIFLSLSLMAAKCILIERSPRLLFERLQLIQRAFVEGRRGILGPPRNEKGEFRDA